MSGRVMTVVLALCAAASCGDDSGAMDASVAGTGGVTGAGTGGLGAGSGGRGGAAAGASGSGNAGRAAGGSSGGGMLGADACPRAPVDSCDLLPVCESVKARRGCAGPIMFVACAVKQTGCAQTASYCAKDANGIEWFFPNSCGKSQIEKAPWTIEAQCGCSDADGGTEDAGL